VAPVTRHSAGYVFNGVMPYIKRSEPNLLNVYTARQSLQLSGERADTEMLLMYRTGLRALDRLSHSSDPGTEQEGPCRASQAGRQLLPSHRWQRQTSWYDFVRVVVELKAEGAEQVLEELKLMLTSQYLTAARRPAYSILRNEKLKLTFRLNLPDWRMQLELALNA
jgi:dTDP-4-dehydrorhamnose reductase